MTETVNSEATEIVLLPSYILRERIIDTEKGDYSLNDIVLRSKNPKDVLLEIKNLFDRGYEYDRKTSYFLVEVVNDSKSKTEKEILLDVEASKTVFEQYNYRVKLVENYEPTIKTIVL